MRRNGSALWMGLLAAAVTAVAGAPAGDRDDAEGQIAPPDWLKFDSLSGKVRRQGGGVWLLRVKWEVEVNDPDRYPAARGAAAGGLDLVIDVLEDGRPLIGPDDAPIQLMIPLDRPSSVDDDEVEFEGHVVIEVPGKSFFDPDDLELVGRLFERDGRQALAIEEDEVSFDNPCRPRFGISVGYLVGAGVCW